MSDNKDLIFLANFLEQYYILPYTHDELLELLEGLKYGHILSKSEYDLFKDLILGEDMEGEILFSGDYNDLINKPYIPKYLSDLSDYPTVMARITQIVNSLAEKDRELTEKLSDNARYLSTLEIILEQDIKRLERMIEACKLFEGESLEEVISKIQAELGWLDYLRQDLSEGKVLSEKNFTAAFEEILKSIDNTADGLSGYIKRVIAESIVEPGEPNGNGVYRLDSIGEALATKVDKIFGYGLSQHDFSDKYKEILDSILGPDETGSLTQYVINIVDRYEESFQAMIEDLGDRMSEYTENQVQEMKKYMTDNLSEMRQELEENKQQTLDGIEFRQGDGPTTIVVGNLSKGTVLEGKSVRDVLLEMLCPDVGPTVSGSIELYGGSDFLIRMGKYASVKRINAYIERGSNPIVRTTFYHHIQGTEVPLESFDYAKDNYEFFSDNKYYVTQSIPSDHFIIEVEDSAGRTARSGTQSINIVYPIFYGTAGANIEVSPELLEGLPELLRMPGETCTVSYTTNGERMLFAIPQGYGQLVDIFDQNGYIITNSFQVEQTIITFEVKETKEDGTVKYNQYNKVYHVYYNNPSTVNTFDITYKF